MRISTYSNTYFVLDLCHRILSHIHDIFFFSCFAKTLYTIRARVEPSKGSELCRAGNMCHLHIALQQVASPACATPEDATDLATQQPTVHSIMYEVLADQTMWAVCGRTAGKLLEARYGFSFL